MQDYSNAVGNESPRAPLVGEDAKSHHARQKPHMMLYFSVLFKHTAMQINKMHTC